MKRLLLVVLLVSAVAAVGQAPKLSPEVLQYVSVNAPVVALEHVKVIDGTGAALRDDQTIVIENGKIAAVGPAASTAAPAGARVSTCAATR